MIGKYENLVSNTKFVFHIPVTTQADTSKIVRRIARLTHESNVCAVAKEDSPEIQVTISILVSSDTWDRVVKSAKDEKLVLSRWLAKRVKLAVAEIEAETFITDRLYSIIKRPGE